jgi:mRNA interferase RelE/StbE
MWEDCRGPRRAGVKPGSATFPRPSPSQSSILYGPLAEDPHRVGEPLRSRLEGYWSARRDQDRVIHSIHEDEALVRVVRSFH